MDIASKVFVIAFIFDSTTSRFSHSIRIKTERHHRLISLELDGSNMFPDIHTQLDGVSDGKRAFMTGNALVVGAIQRVGDSLFKKQ